MYAAVATRRNDVRMGRSGCEGRLGALPSPVVSQSERWWHSTAASGEMSLACLPDCTRMRLRICAPSTCSCVSGCSWRCAFAAAVHSTPLLLLLLLRQAQQNSVGLPAHSAAAGSAGRRIAAWREEDMERAVCSPLMHCPCGQAGGESEEQVRLTLQQRIAMWSTLPRARRWH